ncbi:MAG: FHA domain-containing protein [Cyanobacteria bacterium P01_G01_bin.54]
MSVSNPPLEHVFIIEDGQGRRAVPLIEPSYVIGRDRNCDIYIASLFVSRQHALLRRQVQGDGSFTYLIIDGDTEGNPSVNGLMINGHKQSQYRLKHGDQVVFGPQVWATYQSRQSEKSFIDNNVDIQSSDDPFDITLIDPAMMSGDTEEVDLENSANS